MAASSDDGRRRSALTCGASPPSRAAEPQRLIDLPVGISAAPAADEAWRLQAALDAMAGRPQRFRISRWNAAGHDCSRLHVAAAQLGAAPARRHRDTAPPAARRLVLLQRPAGGDHGGTSVPGHDAVDVRRLPARGKRPCLRARPLTPSSRRSPRSGPPCRTTSRRPITSATRPGRPAPGSSGAGRRPLPGAVHREHPAVPGPRAGSPTWTSRQSAKTLFAALTSRLRVPAAAAVRPAVHPPGGGAGDRQPARDERRHHDRHRLGQDGVVPAADSREAGRRGAQAAQRRSPCRRSGRSSCTR